MRVILGSSSSAIVTAQTDRYDRRTESKPKHKPSSNHSVSKLSSSSSSSSTVSSSIPTVNTYQAPLLSAVPWDLTSDHRYCADLASKLAEDGRLQDFAMIVESVVVSGGNASKFVSMLCVELVSCRIVRSLREGRIECVVEVLEKVDKLGVAPLKLFDGCGMKLLRNECRRIVDSGEVEKFVDLAEVLAGNYLFYE